MSIDRLRNPDDSQNETGPEIYRCPIHGCSRTVVDDVTGLRNHVRNLDDDFHRGKVLDDDLEVMREYDPPEQGTPPSEIRIQSAAVCTW